MRLPVAVRRAVERMRAYHPPLEGRAGKLRLDFNENTVGPSPPVRRALARLSADRVAMYPEYDGTARRLARCFHVRAAELLITNGTDDSMTSVRRPEVRVMSTRPPPSITSCPMNCGAESVRVC